MSDLDKARIRSLENTVERLHPDHIFASAVRILMSWCVDIDDIHYYWDVNTDRKVLEYWVIDVAANDCYTTHGLDLTDCSEEDIEKLVCLRNMVQDVRNQAILDRIQACIDSSNSRRH